MRCSAEGNYAAATLSSRLNPKRVPFLWALDMFRYPCLPAHVAPLVLSPFCWPSSSVSFCAVPDHTSAATCPHWKQSQVRLIQRATDRAARDALPHVSPHSSTRESGERERGPLSFFQGRPRNVARETGWRYEKKTLLDTYHSCPRVTCLHTIAIQLMCLIVKCSSHTTISLYKEMDCDGKIDTVLVTHTTTHYASVKQNVTVWHR